MRLLTWDKNNLFYGETINTYVGDTLQSFYVDLTTSSYEKDKYQ